MSVTVVSKNRTPNALFPYHFSNISIFGEHSIAIVSERFLVPDTIINPNVFGSHEIFAGRRLAPDRIDNVSVFGDHALVFDQFIEPIVLDNVSSFGVHEIENKLQILAPTHFHNTSTFGNHTISHEAVPPDAIAIGTASANATTASITVPVGGVPAGSLIVVIGASELGTGWSSFSDSKSNSYTRAVYSSHAYTPCTEIWYAKNVTALASGDTITGTLSISARQRISAIYSENIDTSSPLDQTAGARGTSSSPSSGATAALAQSGELVIGAVGTTSSRVVTQDADFATPPNEENSVGTWSIFGGHRVESGTSAQSYDPTLNNSQAWGCCVATFKHS